MLLTLSQTATQLGKTQRQIRYLIQEGRLKARKDGGRWVVDAADLPSDGPRQEARARRDDRLRDAAEEALGPRPGRRWGLRDLKAVTIGVPLYQRTRELLGDDTAPARELRAALDLLAIGAHRYGGTDTLSTETCRLVLRLLDCIVLALKDRERLEHVDEADRRLLALRLRLRLANTQALLDERQTLHALGRCDEVGRQLGGWLRHLEASE